MPVHHTPCIEQVRRQRIMPTFNRLASNVGIAEQPLLARLIIAVGQPDHDDMDVRCAARFAAPTEGAMGEGDFEMEAIEQDRPELRHLFALADRIGRDEGDADAAIADLILPGTGRGTSRRLVEGARHRGCRVRRPPSTTSFAGGPPPRAGEDQTRTRAASGNATEGSASPDSAPVSTHVPCACAVATVAHSPEPGHDRARTT